ncbi:hypothetical protein V5O48_004732 [Marasmius crinis-equi]|uniref:Uncharacterized protein n=1 Tax=Marasmius crinis-equi TaxID=585013 RepID=A0ABR3FP88_9AGAR
MPSAPTPSRSLSLKDGGIFKDQANVELNPPSRAGAVTANTKAHASNSSGSSKPPQPTPNTPGPSMPKSPTEPQTPAQSKGKRKADEVDGGGNTPPEARKQRATFANDPRPHRISGASGSSAPSSYTRKRARMGSPSPGGIMPSVGEGMSPHAKDRRSDSRPPSRNDSQRNAGNTGSWSRASRTGGAPPQRTHSRLSQASQQHPRAPSRAASTSRHQGPSRQSNHPPGSPRASSRRGSISQASIPISALISPHAPSISTDARAATFHMRDPRKPPRVKTTPWSLSFPQTGQGERLALFHRVDIRSKIGLSREGNRAREDEEGQRDHTTQLVGWTESGGSPLHSWLFFIGFILFPVWWVAAIIGIPKTRRIGGGQEEKKMTLDDPQVEHGEDAILLLKCDVSLIRYSPLTRCEILEATV